MTRRGKRKREWNSSRIAGKTEPYPNRWTHYVVIRNAEEIDGKLMEWVKEAYQFSEEK